MGPPPTLNLNYEGLLVYYIIAVAKRGFPIVKYDLVNIPNNFKNGRPGKKWMQLFLKHHPEVAERTVEKLTKSRALVSEIYGWFLQIEQYFT